MCAIIGIAGRTPLLNPNWIEQGRDAMRHRGPDDFGLWSSEDKRVHLGHRRLAIIDTSRAGHQPMKDPLGELHIVFNGEIYNFVELRADLSKRGHRFSSNSDTEVILAAYREWGTDCLKQLNGAFAFAIYDSRKRILFIARDRAGEKPLFYVASGESIRFSSELKGLLADRSLARQIDYSALDCYLAMGFVPGELCMLKGFRKLPPAHALVFNLESGQLRIWRYWELPAVPASRECGTHATAELLNQFEGLLFDSVRRQLIADVPVGVLLSGGVDSSLITAMAVRTGARIKTFTIRFPGHDHHDETQHARLIARYFNSEHVELEANESSVEELPLLARQFDEPMADSSMLPTYMVSRLVRDYCTVALGGDGGDELFGGYLHYNRLLSIQAKLACIPVALRAFIARSAAKALPIGSRGSKWLGWAGSDFYTDLPLFSAAGFNPAFRQSLMSDRTNWPLVAEAEYARFVPSSMDVLQRATRTDFLAYLPEDILVKVDRASMLSSLELRAPLLDYRILEFAYGSVPSQLKASSSSRKVLLKMLAAKILPPEFDKSRKQGFTIPLASWLQTAAWKQFFKDTLLDSGKSFFAPRAIQRLLAGQNRGFANSERLFSLVLFELWRKEYQVSA